MEGLGQLLLVLKLRYLCCFLFSGLNLSILISLILHLIICCCFQCPTTVVPFFGDQPFWGERVHARGVGPPPIPVDEFSLEKLVAAINFMLDPKVTGWVIILPPYA